MYIYIYIHIYIDIYIHTYTLYIQTYMYIYSAKIYIALALYIYIYKFIYIYIHNMFLLLVSLIIVDIYINSPARNECHPNFRKLTHKKNVIWYHPDSFELSRLENTEYENIRLFLNPIMTEETSPLTCIDNHERVDTLTHYYKTLRH